MNSKELLFQDCLGVVLAGGKSSRMGQDKATLQHKFKSKQQNMLSYSKSVLQGAGCVQVVVSGDKHGICDMISNMGPLGGIESIISHFKPKALLILPVDLPLMTPNELSTLKQVGELSQSACFFNDNYLPLYLPVNAHVEQFFQQLQNQSSMPAAQTKTGSRGLKGPSVRSLLKQVPYKMVAAKNSNSLFNTNTPEQWQQAQHLLSLPSLPRKTHV